jgi:hypothetical protein
VLVFQRLGGGVQYADEKGAAGDDAEVPARWGKPVDGCLLQRLEAVQAHRVLCSVLGRQLIIDKLPVDSLEGGVALDELALGPERFVHLAASNQR